ncbi:MAG TPA: hypothetical protein VMB51_04630 [Solirubrobacteraceae bacterium]|nr:hypothetical protein [Solirubrobacteraceae bacterium]
MKPRLAVALACVLLAVLAGATPACAAGWWRLSSRMAPTRLAPGATGLLSVTVENLGDSAITGADSPITIGDVLPAGLKIASPESIDPHNAYKNHAREPGEWTCTSASQREAACSTSMSLRPYETLILEIPVLAESTLLDESLLSNDASVQGGDSEGTNTTVPGASSTRTVQISSQPLTFGLEEPGGLVLLPEQEAGTVDTSAGTHPFQLTSTVEFNQTLIEVQEPGNEPELSPGAPALPKDLTFKLPPGLLGNITAGARCSDAQFGVFEVNGNKCPPESAVGVASVTLLEPKLGFVTLDVPLFNLEPAQGEPARFGFEADGVPVTLETTVRTESDYGVTVTVNNATEAAQVVGAQITFWGDPSSPAHDNSRGWSCLDGKACPAPGERSNIALLTLPTSCTGPLYSTMQGQAWNGEPIAAQFAFQNELGQPLSELEHCPALPFTPTIEAQPIQEAESEGQPTTPTTTASAPTGLDVSVKLPQTGTVHAGMLAQADVRSATVALPESVQLNPSAANGLQACSEAQIGYRGPGSTDPLSPGAEEPLHFSGQPATCPQASKLGLVRLRTPLLAEELHGAVYLAEPAPQGETDKNPFDSLLSLYIVAEDPTLGIRAKLAGETKLNPQTGQITSTFADTPQVPFEELNLQLFGGPGGSLTTPSACGSYTASASFTPWSGTPSVNVVSEPGFQITSGPAGASCSSAQPFNPSLLAGATNLQAGGYTSFNLHLSRPDGDQALTGLAVHLPPGDAAILKAVTPCPEPQASEGTCGPAAEIGRATATAGEGPDPFTVTGGRVYITGPFEGAPFGLSIVTPAVAGPFNLGNVVVRSRIEVDPHTAQVTIASPLPTFVQGVGRAPSGVPLDLRDVYVTIDRANFEYNPTSCDPVSIIASFTGSAGATAEASSGFQVSGCQSLPFKPAVSATTQGQTSKADGASLGLTFKSKIGEAHVAKTILTIPATLPARLTTIQKACVAGVFEANPAACPEGSDIGTAIVHTPVLKSPLAGPIYLVSHGNAAWPDAELVLQGEGVTVILDGQTAIKKGVTTSSFLSVPDAPFESVEATLPEGPHSALTTNLPLKDKYSLCGQHLAIPTALTGQNATGVGENVKVTVQGCHAVKASKVKKLTRAQKLAKALRTCRRRHARSRARRATCEHAARKRYAGRARRRNR